MGNRGADGIEGINRAYSFNALNDSKLGITLNLREERARELVKEIVSISDVVSENFTVGVMERMGLDYESLRKVRPDLVMLTATTLGATGPERYSTGWGPNIQSYSGMAAVTGRGRPARHRRRQLARFRYRDCHGVLCACRAVPPPADRPGPAHRPFDGEVVTTMLPEPILEYTLGDREPFRMGNRDPAHAPHNVYRCDGHDQWVAIP